MAPALLSFKTRGEGRGCSGLSHTRTGPGRPPGLSQSSGQSGSSLLLRALFFVVSLTSLLNCDPSVSLSLNSGSYEDKDAVEPLDCDPCDRPPVDIPLDPPIDEVFVSSSSADDPSGAMGTGPKASHAGSVRRLFLLLSTSRSAPSFPATRTWDGVHSAHTPPPPPPALEAPVSPPRDLCAPPPLTRSSTRGAATCGPLDNPFEHLL